MLPARERSQMAEGLGRPSKVNPYSIEVMRELGIDLGTHHSKSVQTTRPPWAVFLGKVRRLHWSVPDPASKDPSASREEMLTRFRTVRDSIRWMLERFAAEELPSQ